MTNQTWTDHKAMLTAAAERFASDTTEHELTILRDDGPYRHLRFAKPGTGMYHFELITWPGYLTIVGDMGSGHTFRRTDDMFAFFRAKSGWNSGLIDPQYWAEKLATDRDSTQTYSEEKFLREVAEVLAEYEAGFEDVAAEHARKLAEYQAASPYERYPYSKSGPHDPGELKTPAELREQLKMWQDDGETTFEEGARQLLAEWESCGAVFDTYEWDLTEYDWSYLWACNAIQWGIGRYDAAKVETVGVSALVGAR